MLKNYNLSELSSKMGSNPIDIFICSASFEERCRSIVDALDLSKIRNSWIAFNEDFKEIITDNLKYLKERLGENSSAIELNTNDPISSANSISKSLENAFSSKPQRVVIDTTTFTRESLLILLKFMQQELKNTDSLEFLYSNASEYSVGDKQEKKWLSKGIHEVRSILGYPGNILPSRRNHLIVLVGFENDRVLSLVQECEPAKISLGIADESEAGTQPHQKTNEQRLHQLQEHLGDVETFTFKGYNADATKDIIQKQIKKFPEFNAIVAPMNTKISTLGAAALALEDENIQLCYAQANLYNYARYSKPGNSFYRFRLQNVPSAHE